MNMHAPDEDMVSCTLTGSTLVTQAITYVTGKLFDEAGVSGDIWDASAGPSVHYTSGEVRSIGLRPLPADSAENALARLVGRRHTNYSWARTSPNDTLSLYSPPSSHRRWAS